MSGEPKTPGHTCPAIDKLKKVLEDAHREARCAMDTGGADDWLAGLKEVEHILRGEATALEELRTANAQLRDCVEYWKARADAAEFRLEELE